MHTQSKLLSSIAVLGSIAVAACSVFEDDDAADATTADLAGATTGAMTTGAMTTGAMTTGAMTTGETGEPETTGAEELVELDISVCDPTNGPFTLDIDNTYFPLVVGTQLAYDGVADGAAIRLEINVLDETMEVAGVTTRVVEEVEYEDGELAEISRNFYVQAPDGTVCYYGEEVSDYEDGVVVGSEGEWLAGGDNRPGIIMPGAPQVNTMFAQEAAPGIAEDMSAIISLDETARVPAGTFDNSIRVVDWDPLEGGTFEDGELKLYAPDIGLVQDEALFLVERGPM